MVTVTRPEAVAKAAECETPDLLIVVVTYNSEAVIERFLEHLPAALHGVASARLVLVDNASSDSTLARAKATAPWASVMENGRNAGYAAGINAALRQSRARKGVLILNADAAPAPGCAARLLDALDLAGVGIAVPRVLDETGRLKYSLRREPTLLRAVGEALLGGHRAARWPRLGDMVRDPHEYVDGAVADWATGAAMLLSMELIDRIGLWDESFFLYSEETDYALRARDAGFELRLAANAVVVHPGGEMSRSPWLWSVLVRSRIRLYRKRHGPVSAAAYWLAVAVNEGVRGAVGRPTHRAAFRSLVTGRVELPTDRASRITRDESVRATSSP